MEGHCRSFKSFNSTWFGNYRHSIRIDDAISVKVAEVERVQCQLFEAPVCPIIFFSSHVFLQEWGWGRGHGGIVHFQISKEKMKKFPFVFSVWVCEHECVTHVCTGVCKGQCPASVVVHTFPLNRFSRYTWLLGWQSASPSFLLVSVHHAPLPPTLG